MFLEAACIEAVQEPHMGIRKTIQAKCSGMLLMSLTCYAFDKSTIGRKRHHEMNSVPGSGKTLWLGPYFIIAWPKGLQDPAGKTTQTKPAKTCLKAPPSSSKACLTSCRWPAGWGWKFCSKSGIQWAKHGFHARGMVGIALLILEVPSHAKSILISIYKK